MRTVDLLDKRFGRLLVIGFSGTDKHKKAKWRCKCDCGNEVDVLGNCLKRQIQPTKSCGCLRKSVCGLNSRRLPPGEALRNVAFKHHRLRARRFKRQWEITIKEFDRLVSSDCYYCGAEPSNRYHDTNYNGDFVYNGIDRLDNTAGYIAGNVVPCCWPCNRMKRELSSDEFLGRVKEIYLRRCFH